MKIKFRNLVLALKDQLPLRRLIRNVIKGHIIGLISKRSHLNGSGNQKVKYNTKKSAMKSAEHMSKKHGVHFSNYKCIWCDGYHIGKNSDNKTI